MCLGCQGSQSPAAPTAKRIATLTSPYRALAAVLRKDTVLKVSHPSARRLVGRDPEDAGDPGEGH